MVTEHAFTPTAPGSVSCKWCMLAEPAHERSDAQPVKEPGEIWMSCEAFQLGESYIAEQVRVAWEKGIRTIHLVETDSEVWAGLDAYRQRIFGASRAE